MEIEGTLSFPFVEVTGYDITMSGPCGKYHFKGAIGTYEDGNKAIYNGVLTNLNTNTEIQISDFGAFWEIINALDNV